MPKPFAVPAHFKIASPSCETDVLDLLAVLASLSPKAVRFLLLAAIPRADIASVARSEAAASSMPEAAARFSTEGSTSADVFAS